MGVISGCGATLPVKEQKAAFERSIPTCKEGYDCKAKWDAAQLWIVKHSGYKLQIVTDVLLETYNATNYSTNIAVRVTKEPLGSGTYRLLVVVTCDNLFGCTPNAWEAALDFNHSIAAVVP